MSETTFDQAGFNREVGLLVQFRRKAKRMTQLELAPLAGISRATLASIEAGRQSVRVDVLWRIAVVLGTSVIRLMPEPKLSRDTGRWTPAYTNAGSDLGYTLNGVANV